MSQAVNYLSAMSLSKRESRKLGAKGRIRTPMALIDYYLVL